jgi:hypothetical protein
LPYRPTIDISFFLSHTCNISAFISLSVALSLPNSLLLKFPSSICIYNFHYSKNFHVYILVLLKVCCQISHHQLIINSTFRLNKFCIGYRHASAQREQRGNSCKMKCINNLRVSTEFVSFFAWDYRSMLLMFFNLYAVSSRQ